MYFQMIYRSRCDAEGSRSAMLRSIVAASERNNAQDGITGFLLFDKIHFMQVLEGEKCDVLKAFDRIASDPRHSEIVVLSQREVTHRAFPEWAMGGVIRSDEVSRMFDAHGWSNDAGAALSADDLVALAVDVAAWETDRATRRGLSGH